MPPAELVATEEIEGVSAYHLRAEGLDQAHEADGRTYTMDAMSLWVDVDELVPLMMRMEGTATSRGKTRD